VETGSCVEPTEMDRYRLLSTYFRNLVETEWPDAIGKMKQFACWFTHGVRNGSELRRNVHTARTCAEILDRVDSFFADSAAAAGVGYTLGLNVTLSPSSEGASH